MPSRSIDFTPLTLTELRALMRPERYAFLPDRVARRLCNRAIRIDTADAREIAELITRLVEEVRQWMIEEGIETPGSLDAPIPKLLQREKKRLKLFATLLLYEAYTTYITTNDVERTEEIISEGIIWARITSAPRQEALLWLWMAELYFIIRKLTRNQESFAKALQAAESAGDDLILELMITGIYAGSMVYYGRYDETLELVEKKLARDLSSLSKEDRINLLPQLLFNKGRALWLLGQKKESILILQEARELARNQQQRSDVLPILSYLGLFYRELGDEESNITFHHEMIRFAEEKQDRLGLVWAYVRIADSYITLQDYRNAEKALELALHHGPEDRFSLHIDEVYIRRAKIYISQERNDEALNYCRRAIERSELSSEKRSASFLAAIYGLMAQVLVAQGHYEEAEEVFRQALDIYKTIEHMVYPAVESIGLAKLLILRGKEEEAEVILDTLPAKLKENPLHFDHVATAYELKSNIAEQREDYRQALSFSNLSYEFTARDLETKAEDSLQKVRVLIDIDLIKAEANFERSQRKEAEKNLAEALLAFEGKRSALETAEEHLRQTVSLLKPKKTKEVVDLLRNVLEKIERVESPPEYSLHYLQTMDQEFFIRLRKSWPDLTRKQEYYCGLIRAGLSSKEIAGIMNIGIEGIRAQRKRLRKRLGLQGRDKLESVIMEV